MFIRKKNYRALLKRISAMETDFNDKLCAFAESLGVLQDGLAELCEEKDSGEEFKQERAFLEGLRGIMSYEATYGRKQDN